MRNRPQSRILNSLEISAFCCNPISGHYATTVVHLGSSNQTTRMARKQKHEDGERSHSLGTAADGGSPRARLHPLLLIPAFVLLGVLAIPLGNFPTREKTPSDRHPAKSGRTLPLPSSEAARGLRNLLATEPKHDIPFEDFGLLAASLDDATLVALLDEIGLVSEEGYLVWTRSALFTEWARRDHDAALDYLKGQRSRFHVRDSVLYAIFCGSRPIEPEQALNYLRSLPEDPRYRMNNISSSPLAHSRAKWVTVAIERIFAKLAAEDPERAWSFLPRRDGDHPIDESSSGSYRAMVAGLFSGLPDAATVEKFVERIEPVGDGISIQIAAAWMNHDIEAAMAWAPPQRMPVEGRSVAIGGVQGGAAWQWARANPQEALRAVRENSLHGIARGSMVRYHLLKGDAHLAPELTELLSTRLPHDDGRPQAWYALRNAMPDSARLDDRDRFPEAGRNNRPPDYLARYQSFLAALEHEIFPPEYRASLRATLDSSFKGHMPEPAAVEE